MDLKKLIDQHIESISDRCIVLPDDIQLNSIEKDSVLSFIRHVLYRVRNINDNSDNGTTFNIQVHKILSDIQHKNISVALESTDPFDDTPTDFDAQC